MRLNRIQAIYKYNCIDDKDFILKLSEIVGINECIDFPDMTPSV